MFEDLEIWTNMRDYEDFIPLSWIKSIQYYQTQQWDLFRTETDYGACEHGQSGQKWGKYIWYLTDSASPRPRSKKHLNVLQITLIEKESFWLKHYYFSLSQYVRQNSWQEFMWIKLVDRHMRTMRTDWYFQPYGLIKYLLFSNNLSLLQDWWSE